MCECILHQGTGQKGHGWCKLHWPKIKYELFKRLKFVTYLDILVIIDNFHSDIILFCFWQFKDSVGILRFAHLQTLTELSRH